MNMKQIFDLWPSVAAFARDIGKNPVTVRHWRNRGSIPGEHDAKIVAAVKGRGGKVTYEQLAMWRSERKRRSAP